MVFLKKYVPVFVTLCLLGYYLVIVWLLHRNGYEHSESLFLAEKVRLLLQGNNDILLTLGTTFPSLVYLSTLVFAPFGYPFAPILASVVFTTILFYQLCTEFYKFNLQRRFFIPLLGLLFFFHPGIVYAAVSGRGVAALIFFFFLVFKNLFRYYSTQTTYYLSLSSIFLTCLIFCNYNFIWLLLAFVPFIVLVSLDGLKQNKINSPIVQYYEFVNIRSQRRKLANRTIAIYVIVFLLPICAMYLFKLLNYSHAGNSNYFLNSQYANWFVTGTESIGSIVSDGRESTNITAQTHLVFQSYILLLTPLMILVFIIFRGKLYELFTLLSPFFLISILLLDNQYNLTIEYYLIFLVLALIGIYHYIGKKYTSKIMYPIIMLVALINIATGIFYFKRTSDREEKLFLSAIKNLRSWKSERVITEEFRMASYISGLINSDKNLKNKILIDDAAAYPIVAHMRSLNGAILPINPNFITVAENPTTAVKYLCIAKDNNRLKGFTVLNEYNLKQLKLTLKVTPVLMFETENWAVYRVIDWTDDNAGL